MSVQTRLLRQKAKCEQSMWLFFLFFLFWNNSKVIWGCVVCENNSKVIWGCVVCENNSKVIWGCADRTVSSNSRHVVSFACLSGRSYRSLGERSVRGVGWGFLIWPSVKVISGRGIIHQITHNSLIHGSSLEENCVKNWVEWSCESEIRKLDLLTVGKASELRSNVL